MPTFANSLIVDEDDGLREMRLLPLFTFIKTVPLLPFESYSKQFVDISPVMSRYNEIINLRKHCFTLKRQAKESNCEPSSSVSD